MNLKPIYATALMLTLAAFSTDCCKPKEIAVPTDPACRPEPPPTPPVIHDTDCDLALCYDRENSTALWRYLEDLIHWADQVYETCKEPS